MHTRHMPMKLHANRGSHLPVLLEVVRNTAGPILELGCGITSTFPLHWLCQPTGRRLVTYEDNPIYQPFALQFASDFHEIRCVAHWDEARLGEPWSVAFVDHSPEDRRRVEIARLTHADFVVVHDTQNKNERKMQMASVLPLFRWHYRYTGAWPHTTVLSNAYPIDTVLNHATFRDCAIPE